MCDDAAGHAAVGEREKESECERGYTGGVREATSMGTRQARGQKFIHWLLGGDRGPCHGAMGRARRHTHFGERVAERPRAEAACHP